MPRVTAVAALSVAVVVCACGKDVGPRTSLAATTPDSAKQMEAAHALLGPGARAQLDTGNAAFRKKAYDEALSRYHKASDLAPQHAAPFFGMYMVARATSNNKLADSAMAEIRKRNGELSTGAGQYSDSALKDLHKKAGAKLPNSGS